ncbi:DUF6285 domain-containing protein [Chelatococcus reniformis]|uniref:DUF6285 domain-containing protein n=1 Tax=Chelatococcus reniformis TaxID=1494448 RepID=A0A916UXW4_9HYPH|nr:DUF6285 domain-containing protein [Chelatococcus reniformis]GGC92034.1 hypothetical protein GCM10010994_57280 [Chelatococcus reniformis]
MQDEPTPPEILGSVAAFLRDEIMAAVPAHLAFHVRVAANAVDLVRRELELAPAAEEAERARLEGLLGRGGAADELNRELADAIAARALDAATPGLVEHLWATSLEKLAVDQPGYSAYRRAKEISRQD